jgi:hypothetical protein
MIQITLAIPPRPILLLPQTLTRRTPNSYQKNKATPQRHSVYEKYCPCQELIIVSTRAKQRDKRSLCYLP